MATDAAANNVLLYVCAINPGVWNDQMSIQIRPSNSPGIQVGIGHNPLWFYIDVFVNYTGPLSKPVESWLVSCFYGVDGFGDQLFAEYVINNQSQYIQVKVNPFCQQIPVLQNAFVFLQGGADGTLPTDGDIISAWQLYTDTEQLSVNVLMNCGYSSPDIQLAMDAICQQRMDCVALLDIPSDLQQTADAITYRAETLNLNSTYSAIYTPDVMILDPYNDIKVYVPLSGFAAAVCARTDSTAQLWFAPAGLNRGQLSVLAIRHVYNQPSRDALNAAQINMLRYFPKGMGIAIWAQNTLSAETSSLSNLNVRRLLAYLEKQIAAAALYSVFELNDVILRARLTTLVSNFLQPIQNNRGLYAFAVICDHTNNTNATIAAGQLILDVFVDPVIPAQRIQLNAVITQTGAGIHIHINNY